MELVGGCQRGVLRERMRCGLRYRLHRDVTAADKKELIRLEF
jgi:hypothetical protein